MNNIKNKQGFTLVELLAVIVVLAIVMLIAVQAVLPAMSESRKNIFSIEANGAIESAQTYFMNNSLGGSGDKLPVNEGTVKCVTVKQLIDAGVSDLSTSNNEGVVLVAKKGNNYLYTVYLTKKSDGLMVNGYGNNGNYNVDITKDHVKDIGTLTYSSCTSVPSALPSNPTS